MKELKTKHNFTGSNKTVLITGGAGGIGSAISWQFASEGYLVAIHYHKNRKGAIELANKINSAFPIIDCNGLILNEDRAKIFQADISQRIEVKSMFIEIDKLLGNIDILINNAGIAQQKLFTDLLDRDWERMFDVNVKGVFLCCQEVLPKMIHNKKGKIINISSMWGLIGASCEVHYSATKAAVIGLTKSLAKELGPSNIQVNAVAPGLIDTPMNASLDCMSLEVILEDTPLNRIGSAKDVANAVLFLASEQADFITGEILNVNGGLVI